MEWENYINTYDDLKNITNEEDAMDHWYKNGMRENRIPHPPRKFFDWEFYLDYYTDLKNIYTEYDALKHWVNNGIKEKRFPHDFNQKNFYFDWKYYISLYEDLQEIDNEIDAYKHWLKNGYYERRCCNRLFISPYNDFKKKIAILFSGDMPEYLLNENSRDNRIKDSILNNFITPLLKYKYDCDIFITTNKMNIFNIGNIFQSNLSNIYCEEDGYYLSKLHKKIDTSYTKKFDRITDEMKYFNRVYNSYNLMKNENKDYDYIISSRLDIIYNYNICDLLYELEGDTQIKLFGNLNYFVLGTPEIMDNYCCLIKNNNIILDNNKIKIIDDICKRI